MSRNLLSGLYRGVALAGAAALCGVVLGADAPAGSMAAPSGAAAATVGAITTPSDDRKLSFGVSELSVSVTVQSVPVKEGDSVKKGQLLEELDDTVQRLAAEVAEIEGRSKARVEAAEADLAEKKAVYDRKSKSGGFSASEVEEAQLDVILREKQLVVSQDELAEAKLKAKEEERHIEQMQIRSPFDGKVLRIVAHEGEAADTQKGDGAVEVVNNDPLYVEIGELNTRQVSLLKLGQKLMVRYPDDPTAHEATVIMKSPVADARSDTQAVRLQMANPQDRDAGLQVRVELPADVAAAANASDHGVAAMGSGG